MSFLNCKICKTGMADCKCPDCDEKLHDIAYDPDGHVAFKWCRLCDKHYERCTCEKPEFFVIHQGKELKMSDGGFKTLAGRFRPDFTQR
jgi:hypothetical protein